MGCSVITECSAPAANQICLQQKGQIGALPQSAVGCTQAFLSARMWAGRRWDSAATPAMPVSRVFPAGGRGWRKPWCHLFKHSADGSTLLLRWHWCLLLVPNLLDEAFAPLLIRISRDGCPHQADSTALQGQIPSAQNRFFCHGSLPVLLTSSSKCPTPSRRPHVLESDWGYMSPLL